MDKILVLHGPNLNLLGTREPVVYGSETLDDLDRRLVARGAAAGALVETYQSNWEGALVDRIQTARIDGTKFILINPGALTHTSVALRDAFAGVAVPFVEIHISNVYARESFRHHSFLSPIAAGVIVGLGTNGYELALDYALKRIRG
jgi:3-dehydroquinate dehydratase II